MSDHEDPKSSPRELIDAFEKIMRALEPDARHRVLKAIAILIDDVERPRAKAEATRKEAGE